MAGAATQRPQSPFPRITHFENEVRYDLIICSEDDSLDLVRESEDSYQFHQDLSQYVNRKSCSEDKKDL